MKQAKIILTALAMLLIATSPLMAAERPIGIPVTLNGMDIAAVYLQPIEMEPAQGPHAMTSREKSDIHLEADVHAVEDNLNGFAAGEWIPYLTIHFTLINLGTNEKVEGMMMPMVASDGPHYGDNVKMPGVGKYKLIFQIESPLKQGFGRHTDKETGVGQWFAPFKTEWTFNYTGVGKKGGY